LAIEQGKQPSNGISRRTALRGGLLAGVGVATLGATSAVLTGTAKASSWQESWAFCTACNSLWWAGSSHTGACPAQSGGHTYGIGDYIYEVLNGITTGTIPQTNFRFCTWCYGLFWGGAEGCCEGNDFGPHHIGDTNYDLFGNSSGLNAQNDWRWCGHCSLIFWQGSSSSGTGSCPYEGGFGPHVDGSSTNYIMYYYNTW